MSENSVHDTQLLLFIADALNDCNCVAFFHHIECSLCIEGDENAKRRMQCSGAELLCLFDFDSDVGGEKK